MVLDVKKLRAYRIPDTETQLTRRDTMLYALGVGLGADPTNEPGLRFVYEKDLIALPTMATVLAAPHGWIKKADAGASGRSVHAGIAIRFMRPIPVEGQFSSRNRLGEIIDKGPGKAALVTTEREVRHVPTGETLFHITSTSMLRGDGGFGGTSQSKTAPHPVPDGAPDLAIDLPTLPQAALIYRLSGDYNPLHADPAHARRMGFKRPILHGLCTFGVAGHALLSALCGYAPERLRAMSARFSSPVYPGDMLRIEMWRRDDVHFRAVVPKRNHEVVLDQGMAKIDRGEHQ